MCRRIPPELTLDMCVPQDLTESPYLMEESTGTTKSMGASHSDRAPQWKSHLTPFSAQLCPDSCPRHHLSGVGCIFLFESSLFYQNFFVLLYLSVQLLSVPRGRSLTFEAWTQRAQHSTHSRVPPPANSYCIHHSYRYFQSFSFLTCKLCITLPPCLGGSQE